MKTQSPNPEHNGSLHDLELTVAALTIDPCMAFMERHCEFPSPDSPKKPSRQVPQVFDVDLQGERFKDKQEGLLLQFTKLMDELKTARA